MNPTEYFSNKGISVIPITEYSFKNQEHLDQALDHGFCDIPFFPTYREFLERSQNLNKSYPNYMVYLLLNTTNQHILGLIAVQLIRYSDLKVKVQNILPDIQKYLYLSWIALDKQNRSLNIFSLLFEYYQMLIRKFRLQLNERIEGAAIVIRRMRPILWSLFNDNTRCPETINDNFSKSCRKFSFLFQPSELLKTKLEPAQDHVLMFFNFPSRNI